MPNTAVSASRLRNAPPACARRTLLAAGAAACALVLGTPAHAQTTPYADKPVTIVVPYAPGGSVDVIGRLLAQHLGQKLGGSFVVDNRAGAGGAIGVAAVTRARPDGTTLLFTSLGPLAVSVHFSKPAFDPLKDVVPISTVATSGLVISASAATPYKTLGDVLAAARSKPGALNYSVTGLGSQTFLVGELLKKVTSTDMVAIQYKGGGPAAAAVAANEVQFGITDSSPILGLAKAGKVRLLAVTGSQRSSSMPEVPTVREAGIPDFAVDTALALFAPAGTPPAQIDQLSRAVRDILQQPEVRTQIKAASHEVAGSTPQELDRYLKSEYEKWGTLIREGNFKTN